MKKFIPLFAATVIGCQAAAPPPSTQPAKTNDADLVTSIKQQVAESDVVCSGQITHVLEADNEQGQATIRMIVVTLSGEPQPVTPPPPVAMSSWEPHIKGSDKKTTVNFLVNANSPKVEKGQWGVFYGKYLTRGIAIDAPVLTKIHPFDYGLLIEGITNGTPSTRPTTQRSTDTPVEGDKIKTGDEAKKVAGE
jgi:hypothetical protein